MMSRALKVAAIVFLIVQAIALIWPAAQVANRPDVRVMGLPLPFFWTVFWIVGTFVVMGFLWVSERKKNRLEDLDDGGGG